MPLQRGSLLPEAGEEQLPRPGLVPLQVGEEAAALVEAEPAAQLLLTVRRGRHLVERAVVDDPQPALYPQQEVVGGTQVGVLAPADEVPVAECVEGGPGAGG